LRNHPRGAPIIFVIKKHTHLLNLFCSQENESSSKKKKSKPQKRGYNVAHPPPPLLCQRPVFVVPEWQTALFTMLSGLVDEAEEDAQTNAGVLETLITKTYVGLLLADLGLNEILEDDNDNNNNNGMAEEDDLAYLNSLNTHTQLQQKSDHQQNSKPTDSNNDQAAPSLGSNNNSALPSGLGQISSRTTIAPLVTLVSLARTAHNGPAISRFLLSKVLAEIGAELEKKEMINERRRRMRVWHVVSR